MITGVKDGKHSVMTWGGPNARLDFDYLNGANNITHMSITNDGKVGIGTTNPGQFELNVVGRINSTLGYSQGSDERYKENIKDIPDALKKIEALNGVTYQFKQEVINGIDLSKAKSSSRFLYCKL